MEGSVGNVGFNLMDRGPNLLDLRFADDILVFGRSRVEAGNLLDALVKHLDRVGLLLNPDKTVVITNEAQPPQTLTTTAGVILRVLLCDVGQKWLGSMLTSRGSKLQDVDVQYHLQQASKVFHMNRWILQMLTRRRVGLAEGSVTECLCKLILFCQMLKFRWNQIGTIS